MFSYIDPCIIICYITITYKENVVNSSNVTKLIITSKFIVIYE